VVQTSEDFLRAAPGVVQFDVVCSFCVKQLGALCSTEPLYTEIQDTIHVIPLSIYLLSLAAGSTLHFIMYSHNPIQEDSLDTEFITYIINIFK
jgi:hypothetical protein